MSENERKLEQNLAKHLMIKHHLKMHGDNVVNLVVRRIDDGKYEFEVLQNNKKVTLYGVTIEDFGNQYNVELLKEIDDPVADPAITEDRVREIANEVVVNALKVYRED